jgi:hypothetical protein
MTTCTTDVCGTGGWTGPLPGDPDDSVILTATPAFSGIDLSWTYPSLNPHAVAYMELVFGVTNDLTAAMLLARVSGDSYYHKVPSGGTYFYWIRVVSAHGTVGSWNGPASATAKPLVGDVIEKLTGQIDNGVLAQSLKAKLDEISILSANLMGEITARENANVTLAQAIAAADAQSAQALNFIGQETAARTTAISAQAAQINTVASTLNGNIGAVQTQVNTEVVRLDGLITSTAQTVTQAVAKAENDLAITQQSLQSKIDTVEGKTDANSAAITNVQVEAANNLANAQQTLQSNINIVDGKVNANSQFITDVQTQAGNNLAAAQQTLQTNINTVDGKVTDIGSLYTVKLNANGLAGGFGVYNNGTEVEAGFDVDNFWIGRTQANKRKPFIVSGGVVYIDEAVIATLNADKINAGTLNADRIALNSLNANKISAGTITTDRIQVGAVTASSEIATGDFTVDVTGYSLYIAPVCIGSMICSGPTTPVFVMCELRVALSEVGATWTTQAFTMELLLNGPNHFGPTPMQPMTQTINGIATGTTTKFVNGRATIVNRLLNVYAGNNDFILRVRTGVQGTGAASLSLRGNIVVWENKV